MDFDIAIIGLGYVGLPLATAFATKYQVIGYDVAADRIQQLSQGYDVHGQVDSQALLSKQLTFTTDVAQLSSCNFFIVTVPTPIDSYKQPDLSHLIAASETIGSVMQKGAIVIYESTVFPGCTEDICVPVLESASGMKYNTDFYCGYSPERINVGDHKNTLSSIIKVTSGSTPQTAQQVDALYASIITAGTHLAPSIKVAEAAKAIENAQRDLNISFINELSLIFDKLEIDTHDVLAAAATKWNFHHYQPGLVGGHCIGVDPYYLTFKAEQIGYQTKVISSGRAVNESMGDFIAQKIEKLLTQKGKQITHAQILILGISFKENSPDIRNSGVFTLYKALKAKLAQVCVHDSVANAKEVYEEYSVTLQSEIGYDKDYDVIVLAVPHTNFETINFEQFKHKGSIIFDIKGVLPRHLVDARL